MPLDIATSKPILTPPPPAYHCIFRSADTYTIDLITELESLLALENYNGVTRQAAPIAYENARGFLEDASRGILFPKPELTPDGDGGIDIEWENHGRRLVLSCKSNDADFISWREPQGRYEGEPATQLLLNERLVWLLG